MIVNIDIKNPVKEYRTVSDRIIIGRFNARPVNLNVIQVNNSTSKPLDGDVEVLYGKLEETLEKLSNREFPKILGNFNAKIGVTKEDHDLYGLGKEIQQVNVNT